MHLKMSCGKERKQDTTMYIVLCHLRFLHSIGDVTIGRTKALCDQATAT